MSQENCEYKPACNLNHLQKCPGNSSGVMHRKWVLESFFSLKIRSFQGQVQGQVWFLTRFPLKVRWEQWCRWNCDLRAINAWKIGIFCCTESVTMTPKSCDHMPTTSLWGVAAKWPTRAPKTKLILCPRDPQGYNRISLSLSGRILKEYRNIMSASTCGIPWGLRNRTHWSARYTNGCDAAQQESQLVWIV